MNLDDEQELRQLLNGCRREERESQKQLYAAAYSFAVGICRRYLDREVALEAVNDGFLKAFRALPRYEPDKYDLVPSFKGWLKKIMVNTALDSYRAGLRHAYHLDVSEHAYQLPTSSENAVDTLSYEELVSLLAQLPPAYRAALNLYAIDGFTHEEIALQLGISVGTSKSNLFKARLRMKELLKKTSHETPERFA